MQEMKLIGCRKIMRHSTGVPVLYLPTDWARKNHVEKGDFIDIFEDDTGRLVLKKREDGKPLF